MLNIWRQNSSGRLQSGAFISSDPSGKGPSIAAGFFEPPVNDTYNVSLSISAATALSDTGLQIFDKSIDIEAASAVEVQGSRVFSGSVALETAPAVGDALQLARAAAIPLSSELSLSSSVTGDLVASSLLELLSVFDVSSVNPGDREASFEALVEISNAVSLSRSGAIAIDAALGVDSVGLCDIVGFQDIASEALLQTSAGFSYPTAIEANASTVLEVSATVRRPGLVTNVRPDDGGVIVGVALSATEIYIRP